MEVVDVKVVTGADGQLLGEEMNVTKIVRN